MATDLLSQQRIQGRIDGVDLLRGLAIFFVLMNHVNMRLLLAGVPYTRGLPRQFVSSLVWNGQPGVQIFFAVSGFLITTTTLKRWGSLSSLSIRGFYLMRFARIAPLLLLLLAILSALHFWNVQHFVVQAKTGGLGRALLAALTFHVNVLEATRGYLPGNWDILWSLSVEEVFYLLFPLVARLFGRGKLLIALLVSLVILGPFARTVFTHGNEVWKEYSYLGGMDAIALGCLTALIVSRFRFDRRILWILGTMGTALSTFVLGFSIRAATWGLASTGLDMTVLALGTCLIIAVVSQTNWQSPKTLRPLLNLGQRSYEIYLTPCLSCSVSLICSLPPESPCGPFPYCSWASSVLQVFWAWLSLDSFPNPLTVQSANDGRSNVGKSNWNSQQVSSKLNRCWDREADHESHSG